MAMAVSEKKDDKKDKDKDKGEKPVLIVVYMPAWSPVIREVPMPNL